MSTIQKSSIIEYAVPGELAVVFEVIPLVKIPDREMVQSTIVYLITLDGTAKGSIESIDTGTTYHWVLLAGRLPKSS